MRTPEGRKLEAEKTVAWFKNYNSLRVALQHLLGAFNVLALARQESGSSKEQLLVVTSKIANIRQQFMGGQIEAALAPTALPTPSPVAQNGASEDGTVDPFATPELRKAAVARAKGPGIRELAARLGVSRSDLYKWIRDRGKDWAPKRKKSEKAFRIERLLKEAEYVESLPQAPGKVSAPR